MNKRLIILLLPILILLNGCSLYQNRIQLFNYDFGKFFNSTPSTVTVSRGDTLYSIARKYSVPTRELIEVNRLSPPYTLFVGRVLRLPTTKYHIVSKGDTFYSIAKRYNVDMSSLSRTNNIDAPYALNIGQRLVLPGSVVGASSYSGSGYTPANVTTTAWKPTYSSYQPSTTPYEKPKPRKSKFAWPAKGPIISQYGSIGKGRTNDGINIKLPLGTNIKAADSGTVAYAGNELKGFGNLILIRHNDGWVTAYAHNDQLFVKKGQKVTKGEKISSSGSSGGVNSPQLHFEIRAGKKPVNPSLYLP